MIIKLKFSQMVVFATVGSDHSMVESNDRIPRETNPVVHKSTASADSFVHRCPYHVTQLLCIFCYLNGLVCIPLNN